MPSITFTLNSYTFTISPNSYVTQVNLYKALFHMINKKLVTFHILQLHRNSKQYIYILNTEYLLFLFPPSSPLMAAIAVLVTAVTLCGFWVMFSSETTTPSLTGRPTVLDWLNLLKKSAQCIFSSLFLIYCSIIIINKNNNAYIV